MSDYDELLDKAARKKRGIFSPPAKGVTIKPSCKGD